MRPYRNLKLESLIQRELNNILLRDYEAGPGVFVTITGVEIDEKLLQAKIKLGVIPFEKEPEVFLKIQKSSRSLQYKLLKKINIKPMPKLVFFLQEGSGQKNTA